MAGAPPVGGGNNTGVSPISTSEPSAGPRPTFDGRRVDDEVRKDGWIFRWDGERWLPRRQSNSSDKLTIPTAHGYRSMLPDHLRNPSVEVGRDVGGIGSGLADGLGSGGGGGQGSRNQGGGGGGGNGGKNAKGLRGVPAGAKLWKVDGQHFLVYEAKVGGRSVRMSWRVDNQAELRRLTSGGQIKADRTLSRQEFRKKGIPNFGTTLELENETKHPWIKFRASYRDEIKIKPWLRNPEMLALHASAWLETGQKPTHAQISQTRWWQTHTAAERAAMERWGSEGTAQFRSEMTDMRDAVRRTLVSKGFNFGDGNRDDITKHFASQLIWGKMGQAEFERVAEQISNPNAYDAHWSAGFNSLPPGAKLVRKDGKVFARHNGRDYRITGPIAQAKYAGMGGAKKVGRVNVVGDVRKLLKQQGGNDLGRDAVGGIEVVRDTIQEWLGPRYGKGFTEREIIRWAEKIERNPKELQVLEKRLSERRNIVLPEYDKQLTWRDIASTWQPVFSSVWGEPADEDSALFESVVKLKDRTAAEAYLRNQGLKRGNEFVENRALEEMAETFGGEQGGAF